MCWSLNVRCKDFTSSFTTYIGSDTQNWQCLLQACVTYVALTVMPPVYLKARFKGAGVPFQLKSQSYLLSI